MLSFIHFVAHAPPFHLKRQGCYSHLSVTFRVIAGLSYGALPAAGISSPDALLADAASIVWLKTLDILIYAIINCRLGECFPHYI